VGYRTPEAVIPDLPAPEDVVRARAADHVDTPSDTWAAVVFSGIDPRWDNTVYSYLQAAAEDENLLLGLSAACRAIPTSCCASWNTC
jgi:hypothetical protein